MRANNARKLYHQNAEPDEGGVVLGIFENVNMCKSFNGIGELAEQAGMPLDELEPGQYLVFYNRAKTMCAVASSGGGLPNITKRRTGTTIPFKNTEVAVAGITESFLNDAEIDFDEAVDKKLFKALRNRNLLEVAQEAR